MSVLLNVSVEEGDVFNDQLGVPASRLDCETHRASEMTMLPATETATPTYVGGILSMPI